MRFSTKSRCRELSKLRGFDVTSTEVSLASVARDEMFEPWCTRPTEDEISHALTNGK